MIVRATALLVGSQTVFLVSGFVINVSLARILGPSDFGLFGLVMSILVVTELLVITGMPEAVQKFGAVHPSAMAYIVRETLAKQIGYVAFVFAAFWVAAPRIAAFFNEPKLVVLLRVAGVDILFFGLYKYVLAIQNGLRRYPRYALLNVTYSTVRLLAILVLVLAGFSVKGALAGNFVGSVTALLLGVAITRLPKSQLPPADAGWRSFVVQNVMYFVALNMLFAVDIWFVKYFLTNSAVGQYVSAAALGKLVYFLSVAISAVLLPEISHAFGNGDRERVNEVVRAFFRWLSISAILLNLVVWLNAREIIGLLYGEEYLGAARILRLIIVAHTLITLAAVVHTILIAQNRMGLCFSIIVLMLALDAAANRLLVPRFGGEGAALAAILVGSVGFLLSAWFIRQEIASVLLNSSGLRMALAGGVTVAVTLPLQAHLPNVLISAGLELAIYAAVLALTGEITRKDVNGILASAGWVQR